MRLIDANFLIQSDNPVSIAFRQIHIQNFEAAANFIKNLPYQRNRDQTNPLAVLVEQCGSCSSKHALLKRLADENGFSELQLILGIFKMNERNTPQIGGILKKNGMDAIPEAHCYLKYEGRIMDYTAAHWDPARFIPDLLVEIQIAPEHIPEEKVRLHKSFLAQWLITRPDLPYTLDEIWSVRESCIGKLSGQTGL